MSKVRRRQNGAAEAGNGKAGDVAATTGADMPDGAAVPDDAANSELFGLNEESETEPPAEHWPTGAELTETGRDIAGPLTGAGDWVLQLDGTDIEFADIERPADGGKGSRIQMWDGSELIFDDDPEDGPARTGETKGKPPRRG